MRSLFLRFIVEPGGGSPSADEVVDDLAARCWKWVADSDSVEREIPGAWEEGVFKLNEVDSVLVKDKRCEGGRFWRMTRDEWGRDEIGQKYVNFIFIVRDEEKVEFSLLQDIDYQVDRVRTPSEDVHPPKIIGEIIEDYKCKFEGESLSGEWGYVTPSKTDAFVENQILSPSRVLPIILISKEWDSGESIIQNIGSLASSLSGIAHVHVLGDPNTKQIDPLLGRQKLYDGTIRIFWPGLSTQRLAADPAWNDMFSRKKFEDLYSSEEGVLIQALINKVCSATSSVPASSSLVKSVRRRIAEEEKEHEVKEMDRDRRAALEELKTADEKIRYLDAEMTRLSNEIGENSIEISQKEDENNDLEARVKSLQFQLEKSNSKLTGYRSFENAIKSARKQNPDAQDSEFLEYLIESAQAFGREEAPEPAPEPEIRSLKHAISEARSKLQNLTFLEKAVKSAEDSDSDADPEFVFEILRWLNDHMWKRIDDEMRMESTASGKVKRNRNYVNQEMSGWLGSKYAESESTVTMDKFGSNKNHNGRLFPIREGVLIRILPHIKLGSKKALRIHLLCLDRNSNVEVVESTVRENGDVSYKEPKKKKAHEVLGWNDFPVIIIGWCGNHLDVAKLNR